MQKKENGLEYSCVSVTLEPLPPSILVVDHNRVNIVDRAVVLSGPLEIFQRCVDRVSRVEAPSSPLPDELLWLDWFELVVDGRGDGLINMTFDLD